MRISDGSSDVCSSERLAGADFLFETEAVAMGDLARIKIGHGRKADMRVGAHIEIARDAGRQFQWPQMIEKDERPDHPARDRKSVVVGKGAAVLVDTGGRRIFEIERQLTTKKQRI